MCRIYGHFNAATSPHELRTVAGLQRHGGPDDHGVLRRGGFAVGCNRLAIMDPTAMGQPFLIADGAVGVVFNGEIYNHEQLRRELRGRGHRFVDDCDGAVLPAMYVEYGDGFVDRLDGMYAIAVLDLRAEPRLLLATDHVGMKPLFYRWDPREAALHFSSEIPSLLAFDAVPTSTWEPGLDAYLATRTPLGTQTLFAEVKALEPATTAVFTVSSAPRFRRRGAPTGGGRSDLRVALAEEVQRLLVADAPVAAITSGGLDSGLVTELAAQVEADLHTFHVAYRGHWPNDERRFAEQIAASTGATYHQVEVDSATFPELLAEVVWHLGQPNADPIALSTYALFGAVRDAGFKVALTGDAADEIFGGYDRMRTAVAAAGAGLPWFRHYVDALGVLPAARRLSLYTPEYAAALRGNETGLPAEAIGVLRGVGSPLRRMLEFEQRYRLPAYHLRRVDHLSMANSVEVRLPFCQPSIVDLGRRLPDRLKICDGGVKRALYEAAAGLLPEDVLHRRKQPFTLPVAAMLAPGTPLWEFARDMLAPGILRGPGQLDPDTVQSLFTAQAAGPDATASATIWALLVYELWREQFGTSARRSRRDAEVAAV